LRRIIYLNKRTRHIQSLVNGARKFIKARRRLHNVC
jgi:hypothetical protein